MADITASMVKELRERTQAGMTDCKTRARGGRRRHGQGRRGHPQEGDRQGCGARRVASRPRARSPRGSRPTASAASSSRSTRQTDFVSRGDDFKDFVKNVLERRDEGAAGADLGAQKYPGTDKTIDAVRAGARRQDRREHRRPPLGRARGQGARRPRPLVRPHGRQARRAPRRRGPPTRRTPSFAAFVDNAAMQIAAMNADRRPPRGDRRRRTSTSRRRSSRRSSRKRRSPSRRGRRSSRASSPSGSTRSPSSARTTCGTRRPASIDKLRQELGKKLGGEVKIHAFVRFASARASRRSRKTWRPKSRRPSAAEATRACASARSASTSTRSRTTSASTACRAPRGRRARSSTTSRSTGSRALAARAGDPAHALRRRQRPRAARGRGASSREARAAGLRDRQPHARPPLRPRPPRARRDPAADRGGARRHRARDRASVPWASARPATPSPTRSSTCSRSWASRTTRRSFRARRTTQPRPRRSALIGLRGRTEPVDRRHPGGPHGADAAVPRRPARTTRAGAGCSSSRPGDARARLPFIGTYVTLWGPSVARWLARGCVGEPLVNLELHGIDVLDASRRARGAPAAPARRARPREDEARGAPRRRRASSADAGYEFVTHRDAARAVLPS